MCFHSCHLEWWREWAYNAGNLHNNTRKGKGEIMLMCEHCIEEIRSRGDYVVVGEMKYSAEEAEEMDIKCDWCDEYEDLYDCPIVDGLY